MPDGRFCTEQHEAGILEREGIILWSKVEYGGNASRPKEGSRHCGDDSTNQQITAWRC